MKKNHAVPFSTHGSMDRFGVEGLNSPLDLVDAVHRCAARADSYLELMLYHVRQENLERLGNMKHGTLMEVVTGVQSDLDDLKAVIDTLSKDNPEPTSYGDTRRFGGGMEPGFALEAAHFITARAHATLEFLNYFQDSVATDSGVAAGSWEGAITAVECELSDVDALVEQYRKHEGGVAA
jgi:hypothetical protein